MLEKASSIGGLLCFRRLYQNCTKHSVRERQLGILHSTQPMKNSPPPMMDLHLRLHAPAADESMADLCVEFGQLALEHRVGDDRRAQGGDRIGMGMRIPPSPPL